MRQFELNYYKPKKIILDDLVKQNENPNYQPFEMESFQCYHPIYKAFFELNSNNYDSVALNHRYHIIDLNSVWDSERSERVTRELFIKFAPLLDPIRYLIGKYKSQTGLQVLPSYDGECHEKIATPNNSSYIDNMFCYLSNQLLHHHSFLHGIEYYGSYLGVQKKFKMNLADDMDYLHQSEYFNENREKIYELEEMENPFSNFGSRNNKDKLMIHNNSNISILSLEELDVVPLTETEETETQETETEEIENNGDHEECIYEKSSVTSSENTSNNSELNYSDDEVECDFKEEDEQVIEEENEAEEEEEDDEEDDEEDEEDDEESEESEESEKSEIPMNGYIYNFPVQMICLEKCSGTLDRLFSKRVLDIDTASSALFQVILTLYAYQKAFQFTHNDLHTNNIMYIETKIENLYYKVDNRFFKVPTYGRLFKLIDFGRAIYKFQGHTLCSDSFAPGGDASTQYNCEPFMNESKPRLEPNPSFDICRLGCSIYDFIMDIEDEQNPVFYPDELQKLIIKWVTDDNGKNVLYKKNGDERYPNFKLYKMIARTVHQKTPKDQLDESLFSSFSVTKDDIPDGCDIIDLDALPSYV